ncbi:hypothetical protein AnigIFM63604_009978 [Aspergillus niger]|uniref:Uncharacterized protein n=1 Tax=Aspergillus niger TaxID=5061 RepID=A0A9W6A490_ASPNG|nr:hypothetical protein AnigIFM63604_009978 [Aspergillus niger]
MDATSTLLHEALRPSQPAPTPSISLVEARVRLSDIPRILRFDLIRRMHKQLTKCACSNTESRTLRSSGNPLTDHALTWTYSKKEDSEEQEVEEEDNEEEDSEKQDSKGPENREATDSGVVEYSNKADVHGREQ